MADTLTDTIKRKLTAHAGHLTKAVRLRLGAEGKNASRRLSDSVQTVLEASQALITLRGSALDYWKYVDQGRRPGKMPPEVPILAWIRTKRIAPELTKRWQLRSLAYVIRRKIGREGIKGTPIFSEEGDKLSKRLEELFDTDIARAIEEKAFKVLQPKQVKKPFQNTI